MKQKNPSPSASVRKPAETYYPVFFDLRNKEVIVVGGGKIAERKIVSLLKAGASVTVISPLITKNLEKELGKGRITHIPREYRKGDLKQVFLVVSATDSSLMNERVSREAPCPVNVVDTPHLCSFIVPSTVHRNPLTIAISTGGVSPAFAKTIRKELENLYGPEFSRYLNSVRKLRVAAMREIAENGKRERFLKAIASERIMKTLRGKGYNAAMDIADKLFKQAKKA
ncbi:MAG: bifunctional precorrin-2 dehydrogenase/sirohydrochlorin ferrochelatase [Thermodesulfovibrionales bacterium]|nr:bifunctional precorrin-2 dehydrogenase/sirohydrochlorin ferrochelatase [Thermodesulfovibrionales bacterium]